MLRGRNSIMRTEKLALVVFLFSLGGLAPLLDGSAGGVVPVAQAADADGSLDKRLATALAQAHFTGTIEAVFHERLEAALGRPINPKLAKLGRLLWFDKIHSLHHDNTCGGCHS